MAQFATFGTAKEPIQPNFAFVHSPIWVDTHQMSLLLDVLY